MIIIDIIGRIKYLRQHKLISEEVQKLAEDLVQYPRSFTPVKGTNIFSKPVVYFEFTIPNEAIVYIYGSRLFLCGFMHVDPTTQFYLKDSSIYELLKERCTIW